MPLTVNLAISGEGTALVDVSPTPIAFVAMRLLTFGPDVGIMSTVPPVRVVRGGWFAMESDLNLGGVTSWATQHLVFLDSELVYWNPPLPTESFGRIHWFVPPGSTGHLYVFT